MQRLSILEAVEVEIARFACIKGRMEGESPVEADDEEPEIVTQTDACAQG